MSRRSRWRRRSRRIRRKRREDEKEEEKDLGGGLPTVEQGRERAWLEGWKRCEEKEVIRAGAGGSWVHFSDDYFVLCFILYFVFCEKKNLLLCSRQNINFLGNVLVSHVLYEINLSSSNWPVTGPLLILLTTLVWSFT